jgi:putative transposase
MPRRARVAVAGIPWHIIQRGNNRAACFYAEEDYFYFLDRLEKESAKFGCSIHTYCLMTNHVHLLLTPQEVDSASLMMKHLGQRYVQYINRRYRRSGTLWEGRFRSCLAQHDHYVMTCYRYIEMNPVRAGMVSHPAAYPWSGYHHNARGHINNLITAHNDYLSLGNSGEQRMRVYRDMLNAVVSQEELEQIRKATNGNYVLGDKRFQQEIEYTLGRRVTPGKRGRPRRVD